MERVVALLQQKHLSLIEEAERYRITVETEVRKLKSKTEIDNVALCKEIEIGEINYQACAWILIVMYLVITGTTSKGVFEVRHDHMMLP